MALNFDASEMVTGDFLKAEHIQKNGDNVTVTVLDGDKRHFEYPDGKEEDAIVLKFAEVNASLKLNKTRTKSMIKLFGPMAGEWIGQKLVLTTSPTAVGDTIVIKAAPKNKAEQHEDAVSDVIFE